MLLIGLIVLLSFTFVYSHLIKQAVIQEELHNLENLARETAEQMNTQLKASADISKAFSSAPVLRNTLLKSNSVFGALSDSGRREKIASLNRRWMEISDSSDPFIQGYLTNPAADFLKRQQKMMPGMYGEIFLTNKYGALTAATDKLTTLAHSQKYWWQAAYANGRGRIFFDDRGFDDSVDGYVLGVVVPLKVGNKIIGILKSNINLDGPLTSVVGNFESTHQGKIQIVRTKGLVVAEKGKIPLSGSVPEEFVRYLKTKETGARLVEHDGRKEFIAFSPIQVTLGSDKEGFGGKYESIDHIKGNEGEAWHVVITLEEKAAMVIVNSSMGFLIIAGLIFIVLFSVISLFLGRWFAAPLIQLSDAARKIGNGDLTTKVRLHTADEIGELAQSINKMTENLKKTLVSRNNLRREVELRKEAESQTKIQLREKEILLRETHHRIKNNFASISSLLTLQSDSVTNPEALSSLEAAIGRVNSMAALYERMLLKDNYRDLSVREYLEPLVDEVVRLLSGTRAIRIEKQIADVKLGTKILFPVGIIVNELLTNSMKYAFTGRDSGTVAVTFTREGGSAVLVVQDDGIGLPEGFGKGEGRFGFMLVEMLARQLRGSISVDSNHGTRSVVRFRV